MNGWFDLHAQRRNGEPPVRHLLQQGRRICNRWVKVKVAEAQDPSRSKCALCLRIVASAERQGQYKDPEVS